MAQTAGVREAAASIIKITGVADACNRGQEGSGWVVARERVVTNAHVVAGMEHRHPAHPRHRPVLHRPGRPLRRQSATSRCSPCPACRPSRCRQGADLARGDSGVVAGFPLDGPYRLDAARVREVVDARGSDIYGRPGTSREVYSLFAQVRPGNSGGPLLSTDGRVVGVVFAKSLDDPSTGYALTMDEARPVLDAAGRRLDPGRHRRLRRRLTPWRTPSGDFWRTASPGVALDPAGGTPRSCQQSAVTGSVSAGCRARREVVVHDVGRLLGQEVTGAGHQVPLERAGDVGRGAAGRARAAPRGRARRAAGAPARVIGRPHPARRTATRRAGSGCAPPSGSTRRREWATNGSAIASA